ncbi:MAG: TonB family protein [Myxococcales bacterium]|nr:TonB family protein [Myxococcales bacterium]
MAQQPQGPQQTKGGGKQRPGAMTMAMQAVAVKPQGPKVLRIGLIQDGKIVEERIIRKRETVSIGSSEKNHFVVPAANLPARFDVFQLVGDDYILNFTSEMSGRVALPGGVQQLDQLRTSGGARNAGSHWQVKLNDNSRGKIVVGNTTLLFQFVVPPPVTPRPQLPAAARGGLVAGIDWLFTAFVVFSYMTFFGFVIYLENADWEIRAEMTALPENIARLMFQEPPPPPEPQETPETTETTDEATDEVADATPSPSTSSSAVSDRGGASGDPSTNAEARARIAEQAAAAAEAMILGALDASGGALANVLAGGAVTGSQEDILAAAGGVGVATSSSGGTLREGSGGGTGSGEGGDLGQLGMGGSGAVGMTVTTSGPAERQIRGRLTLQAGGDIGGSGDFDARLVVSQIRARLSAIQRCYETELRRNPTLAGKVTVQFTIEVRGNVTGARATENTTGSPAVADCVVSTVSRFRFNPGPEGGSVSFSYPFVFAPQN